MSRDLVVLAVAMALGIAVFVLGLLRNLSETTRNGLPRFGSDPGEATVQLRSSEGEEGRRPPSPREMRRLASLYLGLSLVYAALAVGGGQLFYAVMAAAWALMAVWWLKRTPRSTDGSASDSLRRAEDIPS